MECAAENNIVHQLGTFFYNPGMCMCPHTHARAHTHQSRFYAVST